MTEKPQLIPVYGENPQKHFVAAKREWEWDQRKQETLYDVIWTRAGQLLTRVQRIALEEHRQFHKKKGTFSYLGLEKHITIMRMALRQGSSFMEAHQFALRETSVRTPASF